ncbi:hypothetical protein PYW07_010517 [Mythimna separata]|uniref:Uncharacterized protein n=1 Tax=Mythimna separata TaxID=271217 RepID=A0AAD7YAR4_MYTSE|nr:hypothetical protein PYW07_010517 [Mythimna separata]
MGKDGVSCLSCLYCCEDHFNIEEDTTNYMQYRIMSLEHGQRVTLKLKKGIVPHVFQCQKMEELQPPERKGAIKRKRQALVEEAVAGADLPKAGPSKASRSEADPRETIKSEVDSEEADSINTFNSEIDSHKTDLRETIKSEIDSDEIDLRETIKSEIGSDDGNPRETIKSEINSDATELRESIKSEADSDKADFRETIKSEVDSDDADPGETLKSAVYLEAGSRETIKSEIDSDETVSRETLKFEVDSDETNLTETIKSEVDIDDTGPSTASVPYSIDLELKVSGNKIDSAHSKTILLDKAVQVNLKVHYRSKGVNVNLCKCK